MSDNEVFLQKMDYHAHDFVFFIVISLTIPNWLSHLMKLKRLKRFSGNRRQKVAVDPSWLQVRLTLFKICDLPELNILNLTTT